MIMRLELICSGLTKLLVDNNYSVKPQTLPIIITNKTAN